MIFNKNDVSGSSIVPNYWKHWMTAFHKDVTCVTHWWWWGPYLSTTKYHNDNMKCPTTITIIYQAPRNYYKEYQVPGSIKNEKRQGKKVKKRNETKTNKHACAQGVRRVRRGQGWFCLLVIRSDLWCVQLMDIRRTTKKARRTQPRRGQRQSRKNQEYRPQRRGGFSLNLDLCLVFRGDLLCVISQDTSRHIVTSCPASCDITRYGMSRYRTRGIIYISRICGTDMEISYPVDLLLDTKLGALWE